jgi:N utilization substance protein A
MAAMVVPGAPVSVLVDHGLTDGLVEKLMEGGVSTVEQLGAMTPEDLEQIPGIGPKMVEKIQTAVVSYYGQFEEAVAQEPAPAITGEAAEQAAAAASEAAPDSMASEAEVSATAEDAGESNKEAVEAE